MSGACRPLFIVFLRFGQNRAQASQWMAGHKRWIQQGLADGSFLLAGSLEDAQGGVVLATGCDSATVLARVEQDPFVVHGVVTAEIHAVTPALMADGMAALLQADLTGRVAP